LKRVAQGEFVGACPRCGGRDRFSVNVHKQVFNCRGCGKGGDVIAFVQLAAGVDFLEACRELAGERPRAAPQRPAERPVAAQDNDAAKTAMALRLWKDAHPIEGTLAETYLRQVRGLDLLDDLSGRVLRFHPACWFDRDKHPCLLALYRSIAGDAPIAIMRTALALDGAKIGRLALGSIARAAS
jgi:putative DNA primase/helicase